MTFSVYVLQCADGTYFVDWTHNLPLMVDLHRSGATPGSYTFRRRPVFLVHSEDYLDQFSALNAFKQLKSWPHSSLKDLAMGKDLRQKSRY